MLLVLPISRSRAHSGLSPPSLTSTGPISPTSLHFRPTIAQITADILLLLFCSFLLRRVFIIPNFNISCVAAFNCFLSCSFYPYFHGARRVCGPVNFPHDISNLRGSAQLCSPCCRLEFLEKEEKRKQLCSVHAALCHSGVWWNKS